MPHLQPATDSETHTTQKGSRMRERLHSCASLQSQAPTSFWLPCDCQGPPQGMQLARPQGQQGRDLSCATAVVQHTEVHPQMPSSMVVTLFCMLCQPQDHVRRACKPQFTDVRRDADGNVVGVDTSSDLHACMIAGEWQADLRCLI
jgi:hypothetical protein